MKAIPPNTETIAVAGGPVWFEPAAKALADPGRLMAYAYAFARATRQQMTVIRRYLDDDLKQAFDAAPPGIIDPRSWAYLNARLGRQPAPPLPERRRGQGRFVLPAGCSHNRLLNACRGHLPWFGEDGPATLRGCLQSRL